MGTPLGGLIADGYKKLKEPRRSYMFLRLGSLLFRVQFKRFGVFLLISVYIVWYTATRGAFYATSRASILRLKTVSPLSRILFRLGDVKSFCFLQSSLSVKGGMHMSADNVTSLLTLVVALFGSYAAVATLFYHIGKDVGSKGNKKR
jgi:hypothetical protein